MVLCMDQNSDSTVFSVPQYFCWADLQSTHETACYGIHLCRIHFAMDNKAPTSTKCNFLRGDPSSNRRLTTFFGMSHYTLTFLPNMRMKELSYSHMACFHKVHPLRQLYSLSQIGILNSVESDVQPSRHLKSQHWCSFNGTESKSLHRESFWRPIHWMHAKDWNTSPISTITTVDHIHHETNDILQHGCINYDTLSYLYNKFISSFETLSSCKRQLNKQEKESSFRSICILKVEPLQNLMRQTQAMWYRLVTVKKTMDS